MMISKLTRYGIPAGIAVMLVATFCLYRFSYFWLDDFNTLYWVQQEGLTQKLLHIIDLPHESFRPIGMFAYWLMWRAFGLRPIAYTVVRFALHALNTGLLYILLRRATRSPYAAGFALIPFVFRSNFGDMYWTFATIFELLALALMLAGILLYMRLDWSLKSTLLLALIYILAIEAKEIAITLPVLWFAYDWLVRRKEVLGSIRTRPWPVLMRYGAFGLIALWFTAIKLSSMGTADPTGPYYMNITVLTFGRGYGWFFNALFDSHLRWGAWIIASVILAALFAFRRNGWALFFLAYTMVTLLPVIFLVNHRYEVYWYVPFGGLAGLLALAVQWVAGTLRHLLPRSAVTAVLSVAFLAAAALSFGHELNRSRERRDFQAGLATEFESFVRGVQAAVPSSATSVYYLALPRFFLPETALSSTQVALKRMDIDVKVVESCEAGKTPCLLFSNGRLLRMQ